MNLKKLWASRQGYTIDQTILIVAIIAILITLIIVTIGWTLLNRTSGTKLASQLGQVDDAIAQYYDANKTFPTTANQLQGAGLINFRVSGTTFINDFGGQVRVLQLATGAGAAQTLSGLTPQATYVWVEQRGVPIAEAKRTDDNIDGAVNGVAGRLGIIDDPLGSCPNNSINGFVAAPSSTLVTLCYAATRM